MGIRDLTPHLLTRMSSFQYLQTSLVNQKHKQLVPINKNGKSEKHRTNFADGKAVKRLHIF